MVYLSRFNIAVKFNNLVEGFIHNDTQQIFHFEQRYLLYGKVCVSVFLSLNDCL